MMRQQIRRPRWLLIACLLSCGVSCCDASFENKTGPNENNSPRVFSPRMDYDEWTPLGRGDPLKNDPTFDYVPPILDRVQYWMDSHTTESSSKSDILVLGVTAKKTSPKIPEQFLKFVNGPKFMRNQDSQGSYINDFTGSRGAEPPKVIRKTIFRNGIKDYRNQERIESIPASYYSSSYYNQNLKPETMMLPPPLMRNPDANLSHQLYDVPTKNRLYPEKHRYSTQTEAGPIHHLKHQIYDHPQNSYSLSDLQQKPPRKHHNHPASDIQKQTTRETSISHIETIKSYTPSEQPVTKYRHDSTTPSVYTEKSNLIYQSSQTISDGWLAKTRQPTVSSVIDVDSVTWKTEASNNREHFYDEDHQADGSSHHDVVLGPNANIIVEGDTSDKEEIVIGQKEVIPPSEPSSEIGMNEEESKDESKSENMYIVLANSSPTTETETAVTVVMPEKLYEKEASTTEKNDKQTGQSTSATLDIEIEKSEEKPMHHSFGNILKNPQGMVFMNEQPVQPNLPIRISTPYQQTPTRLAPHREFGDSSPQRVIHHQPSHARPAQLMTHYNPHVGTGMGMSFRETQPPPPPPPPPPHPSLHSGMHPGHIKPNMRYVQMQPFKTMTMSQPSMMNLKQQNQPNRFYQHQPTTMTSNINSMTSMPINSIRDLLLKNEAHRNSQRVPEILETTTLSMPSMIESLETISNTTKANVGMPDVEIKDDDTRKIAATTVTTTEAIPTTTVQTLTTDPIFSHYKQPANPMRGPMYLIIQGHSKVKTYKPWIDKHGNQVEKKENVESTTRKHEVSEFEKFVEENTKKIADAERIKEMKKTTERPKEQAIGQDSLLSFVDSGIGAFHETLSRRDLDDKTPDSLTDITGN